MPPSRSNGEDSSKGLIPASVVPPLLEFPGAVAALQGDPTEPSTRSNDETAVGDDELGTDDSTSRSDESCTDRFDVVGGPLPSVAPRKGIDGTDVSTEDELGGAHSGEDPGDPWTGADDALAGAVALGRTNRHRAKAE